MGALGRTPERLVVIGEGSSRHQRHMVVSSSSDDDVPVPPTLSPPVVEEMAMTAGGNVNVGDNIGGGTTTAESMLVPEEQAAATPSVVVESATLTELGELVVQPTAPPQKGTPEARRTRAPEIAQVIEEMNVVTSGAIGVVPSTGPMATEVPVSPAVQASMQRSQGQGRCFWGASRESQL